MVESNFQFSISNPSARFGTGFQSNQKNRAGFTLIELLVVVAIFMIVYVFSYQGFRDNRRLEEFRLANEQLATNIRKAQTMALTGITNQSVGDLSYGIYLETAKTDRYLLFEDTNSNKNYDEGTDAVIETIIFPTDIILSTLSSGSQLAILAIVFVPPKPTIYFNGLVTTDTASITLIRSNVAGKMGAVDINRISGRITAELDDI